MAYIRDLPMLTPQFRRLAGLPALRNRLQAFRLQHSLDVDGRVRIHPALLAVSVAPFIAKDTPGDVKKHSSNL
jgi:hypothetical protein